MLDIGQPETLDKKRKAENPSHQTEIEIDDKRVVRLPRFVDKDHRHTAEATAQKSKKITLMKRMEIRVHEDINTHQTNPDKQYFPLFNGCSEQEEGKRVTKRGKV